VAEGQRLYREMQGKPPFQGVSKVPLEVLLAMWAVTSDYGRSPPGYDMLQAQLMRGAYKQLGYPEAFEIYDAARIILEGKFERNEALAYADGRIGQVRMLPGDYFQWAKDGDGDGRADIWRSRADILKTFDDLMAGTWNDGVSILAEIEPVGAGGRDPVREHLAAGLPQGQPIIPRYFKRVDGKPWPSDAWAGNPFTPFGSSGPTFLMTRNAWSVNVASPFRERHGDYSGMDLPVAVGLLADAIAGRPGPSKPIR
jgi:membrane-bound lytic murein transglycosylase B